MKLQTRLSEKRKDSVVLFIHGFPEFGGIWNPIVTALGSSVAAIAPNLPGFSAVSKNSEPSVEFVAEQLRELMVNGGYQRFSIVAHDVGGVIGWYLATKYPEQVLTYVAISAPHPADFINYVWIEAPESRALYLDRMVEFPSKFTVDPLALARTVIPRTVNDRGSLFKALQRSDPVFIASFYRNNLSLRALDYWSTMSPCRTPTLAISGSCDPYVPEQSVFKLEERVSGPLRIDVMHDQGHFLPQRNSNLLAKKIYRWILELNPLGWTGRD